MYMCGLSMDRSVSLHCIAHVWEHYLYCFPYKAISLHDTSRQWWVISELCHGNVYTMADILVKYVCELATVILWELVDA